MSAPKPTPGPWLFLEEGQTEEISNACMPLTICSPTNDDVANVYSSDDATVSISREEAIANARLISAAPDLLDALEPDILDAIAIEIDCFEHSARAASLRGIAKRQRAALAKAGAQ